MAEEKKWTDLPGQEWRKKKKDIQTADGAPESMPEEESNTTRVPVENPDERGWASTEDENRWTPEQRDVITEAYKAIMGKDRQGRNTLVSLSQQLRATHRLIDENDFFNDRGVYAEMVRNDPEVARAIIASYRKMPSVGSESEQLKFEFMLKKISEWEKGDLSKNEFQRMMKRVEEMQQEVWKHENQDVGDVVSEEGVSTEGVEESEAAAGEEGDKNISKVDTVKPAPTKSARVRIPQKSEKWMAKLAKIELKNEQSKEYKEDAGKIFSLFGEMSDVVYSNEMQWDGKGTTSWLAADYDDKRNKSDIVKFAQRVVNDEIVQRQYIVNTTDGAIYGIQKTADTLRFIENAWLSTLEFGVTDASVHGVESQGKHRGVPMLNYVVSRPLQAEIALLHKIGRFDMIAVHPVQLMRLMQAHAQVSAFLGYMQTEYSRNNRGRANREKAMAAFKDLKVLFTEAIAERKATLKGELEFFEEKEQENTITEEETDILEMLRSGSVLWTGGKGNEYGEKYDLEHERYMRVFRPDRIHRKISLENGKQRTGAWDRLEALLEMFPPVITDAKTRKKIPVVMDEKRAGIVINKETKAVRTVRPAPRGKGFMTKSSVEVVPNPGDEVSET